MKRDMTTGKPGRTLFFFAVPMVLGNLFQQLYNIIDSVIVGNYVGADALAAVGASSSIVMLFVAVVTGLCMGGSVVIGQLFGADLLGKVKTSISTMIMTALAVSIVLTVVGILLTTPILRWMQTPEDIIGDASAYLNIYFCGILFLFLYNSLTAVFNALGDSRTPLVFLAFSSLLNVGLDLLFVRVFSMGVPGVAIATVISQGVSAILSFIWLKIRLKKILNHQKAKLFDWELLKTICNMAIPSCLQQSIVSLGFVGVQALVNRYGPSFMAGYTAAIKIDAIAILPMANVGNAVSTFTAQNIGAGKLERVKSGLRAGCMISACFAIFVSLTLILFGDVFIGAFVDTAANPEVIATGESYLRVVGVCYIIMGTMNNFNGILRGAGDVRRVFINTLCNFGTRLLLAYGFAGLIGPSAIWYSIPVGWAVSLVMGVMRYRSGKWKTKSLVSK